MVQTVTIDNHDTEEPPIFYYRDAQQCVEYLFNNPLFADHMNYVPVIHLGEDGERIMTEPVSGQAAWDIQVRGDINFSR